MRRGITGAEENWRDRVIGPVAEKLVPSFVHPNVLTLSRVVLLVVAIAFYLAGFSALTQVLVLSIAALTDGLDGTLARRRGQTTRLGERLDHWADAFLGLWIAVIILRAGLMPRPLLMAILVPEILQALLATCFAVFYPIGANGNVSRFLLRSYTPEKPRPTTTGRIEWNALLLGFLSMVLGSGLGLMFLRFIGAAFICIGTVGSFVTFILGAANLAAARRSGISQKQNTPVR